MALRPHFPTLQQGFWSQLNSRTGRHAYWQFLPPVLGVFVKVDSQKAVQVREYTTVYGRNLQIYCTHEMYVDADSGLTVIEYDKPGEYHAEAPAYDGVYNYIDRAPGAPLSANVVWGIGWWCTELEITAYGGRNDGNVGLRVELAAVTMSALPNRDVYFVPTPGTRRIVTPFCQVDVYRIDWTGGAVYCTYDLYVRIRSVNVGVP